MINEDAIKAYIFQRFRDIVSVDIKKLGSGVQGSGFLIEMKTPRRREILCCKDPFKGRFRA